MTSRATNRTIRNSVTMATPMRQRLTLAPETSLTIWFLFNTSYTAMGEKLLLSKATVNIVEHFTKEIEIMNESVALLVRANKSEDFASIVFSLIGHVQDQNPPLTMSLLSLYCTAQEANSAADFALENQTICQIIALLEHIHQNLVVPSELIFPIIEGFRLALKTNQLTLELIKCLEEPPSTSYI